MHDVKLTAAATVPGTQEDAMQPNAAASAAGQPSPAETTPDEVTPEILKVIQTAAAMFLGKKVRVVSVKARLTVDVNSSAWAHQGRNMIQASHNLVQRGR